MKYVILRDDDTNALTPIDYLERLYRPFLDRGLPVNLAVIPNVNTEALHCDGAPELFLMAKTGFTPKYLSIASNQPLLKYLRDNPGYQVVQHGCRHEFVGKSPEFDHDNRQDIACRLDEGVKHLLLAGFKRPLAFVAPYDRLSRTSLEEVTRRFPILSTGWYELRRLPRPWLPAYGVKKVLQRDHWKIGSNILLSHPGCHLSYHKNYGTMLDTIKQSIDSHRVTVLVTHWWEYFRDNKADERFINILHETAAYLKTRKDVRVISFETLVRENIALN